MSAQNGYNGYKKPRVATYGNFLGLGTSSSYDSELKTSPVPTTDQPTATVPTYEEFLNLKNASYTAASEKKDAAITYANSLYDDTVNALDTQKTSDLTAADEQRKLLLGMSGKQRNATYAAAERQRIEAEKRADIERERGIVDADSSYEQNVATYGAKAEAMGRMGLSGSGYGDYLNTKAYAQQRADVQEANARADTSKREARYTEDQSKLQADSQHHQNSFAAESAYGDRVNEINTTYNANVLKADRELAKSVFEAESTERDEKLAADLTYDQNVLNAETIEKTETETLETTSYQNYLTILNAIRTDSTSYSEADIDRAVTEGGLTQADADSLKKELADARVREINNLISYGDTEGATAKAEELFGAGKIDKTTYQTAYFDSWAKDIASVSVDNIYVTLTNLEKDKNEGKISASDFKSLKKYAWSKIGTAQTATEAGVSNVTKKTTGFLGLGTPYTEFTINGKTYKSGTKVVSEKIAEILNGISTGKKDSEPIHDTIVRYNGKTYAQMGGDLVVGWVEITAVDGSDSYGETIDHANATTPIDLKHKDDSQPYNTQRYGDQIK